METGPRLKVSSDRLVKPGNPTCDSWFTRQVAYPLHHSGSSVLSEPSLLAHMEENKDPDQNVDAWQGSDHIQGIKFSSVVIYAINFTI